MSNLIDTDLIIDGLNNQPVCWSDLSDWPKLALP